MRVRLMKRKIAVYTLKQFLLVAVCGKRKLIRLGMDMFAKGFKVDVG